MQQSHLKLRHSIYNFKNFPWVIRLNTVGRGGKMENIKRMEKHKEKARRE